NDGRAMASLQVATVRSQLRLSLFTETGRPIMNKELGVWTYQDCALVLIDYQKEMFDSIRSETKAALADLNVRLLTKTARAFDMPIVLSTVGVAYKINSPTVPSIAGELSG